MRHQTCVTLACGTPEELCSKLGLALSESEYAELRLDYLRPGDVVAALDSCREMLGRCVCTLRPKTEGGRFGGTEAERRTLLARIAGYEPYLLDVEYETLRGDPDLAASLAGGPILVSWHDFADTPDAESLASQLKRMAEYSVHVKIATMARAAEDPARVLSLYALADGISLIAFCMGDLGRISRLACLYLGAPFTYVSLGKAVAPGQYSLKEVRRLEEDPEGG